MEHRYLLKPTDEAYDGWCRANGHVPDPVDLVEHGGKGLWIGDKSAKNVMVFYHGEQQHHCFLRESIADNFEQVADSPSAPTKYTLTFAST